MLSVPSRVIYTIYLRLNLTSKVLAIFLCVRFWLKVNRRPRPGRGPLSFFQQASEIFLKVGFLGRFTLKNNQISFDPDSFVDLLRKGQ